MDLANASANDLEAVVALWERCNLTRPWNDPRRDFTTVLGAVDATVLVGIEETRVIATVMGGFDGHRGWAYYLAVEPSNQREGRGRMMMEAAEEWLRRRGAPKLHLMVRKANSAILTFYHRLGFERQEVITLGKRLGRQ